ncbi:MAG TPA: Spy/CpxP family protein refolding chaperone [Pyrinomonadaceae bacterium]|nr:Spy/CpxP family protein refolding chaperone [Pyrinomonadaceae bacterium]
MKKLGKVKLLAIASLSAVVLIVASVAVAQSVKTHRGQGQRGAWMGRGFHGGGAFKQLNLTDDQKAKMKQIRQSFMESNKPLLEQLRAKRQELRQESEGGTFNEALTTQKLTEMAGLQAKAMGARFALRQQMLAVLTTEQKAQLDQLKAQFKTHRGPRRGKGGPRDNE